MNSIARFTPRIAKMSSRQMTTLPGFLQKHVWKKSQANYLAYIMISLIGIELAYDSVTNSIWESNNQGKLYHHVDWSKFKSEDDEE